MCAAASAALAAPEVPLLGEPRLDLLCLEVRPAGGYAQFFPELLVELACSYKDQLGGPVFHEQDPGEIVCTDSTGKVLKVHRVTSESRGWYHVRHGDDCRISLAMQIPSPGAEWVRLKGSLLCGFADDLVELPAVVLPLKEEAAEEISLPGSAKEKITLSLTSLKHAWKLQVEGKPGFYFESFSVKDDCGVTVPRVLHGKSSGRSSERCSWGLQYLVPDQARSLQVAVSYWRTCVVRRVPVDVKIRLGGI